MKKIFGIILGLMLSINAFSHGKVIFTDTKDPAAAKELGVFHFQLDENFTLEEINRVKAFYTEYFNVTFTALETGANITITLIDNTESSRRIIHRFFSSLEVNAIDIMGTDVSTDDFMRKFIL